MGFGAAIKSAFQNYVNFSGRAVRSEYWYFVLFNFICVLVTTLLDLTLFPDSTSPDGTASPLTWLFTLAILLPSLAVATRRLHDTDRSGWWLLLYLTVVFVIFLLVWFCDKSDPGPNRFGPPRFTTP